MFNRKLKEKVEWLEAQVGIQRQKIKQLECSHKSVKFMRCVHWEPRKNDDGYSFGTCCSFDVVCKVCGKAIDNVDQKEKARMEYEQAKEEYNRVCGGLQMTELQLIAKRQEYKTSHILHLLLSVMTAGFWIPVWILVAVNNGIERGKIDYKLRKL